MDHGHARETNDRITVHWIAVVLVSFACGCASEPTPYQPATGRSGKGYSEKRVAPDRFTIKYVAGADTSDYVLTRYLRRRAAEVTLQYGFRYFAILHDPSRPTHLEARDVPIQDAPRKWETVVVEEPIRGTLLLSIQCFKDPPESADAPLIDARACLDKAATAR